MIRTLLERFCGARLIYQQACMTRIISFEYLNRQLVWQELSEVLLFLLPLLDVGKLRAVAASYLNLLPSPSSLVMVSSAVSLSSGGSIPGTSSSPSDHPRDKDGTIRRENAQSNPSCPLCGSKDILLPYLALPCRHVFCYYCLRSFCEADSSFSCPVDKTKVLGMRRWSEDSGSKTHNI
jgi:peroxin-2